MIVLRSTYETLLEAYKVVEKRNRIVGEENKLLHARLKKALKNDMPRDEKGRFKKR